MSPTVKMRIPVAVDSEGRWFSYGYHNATEDDAKSVIYEMAEEPENFLWFWLVAELPVPCEPDFAASVEPQP